MQRFLGWHAVSWDRLSLVSTVVLLCVLSLELLLFALVTAQENHCDRDLNAPAGHPYGYRLRGDRCEGIYVQEVNCTTLRVASLIESFEDYDPASGKDLLVQWPAFGHSDIRLRTQSLKRRLYYRMDTVRPPGSTSYTWPSHFLAALKISKRELGIMGVDPVCGGQHRAECVCPAPD
jgi:hypothetical protein